MAVKVVKRPGTLTFLLSVTLAVVALVAKFGIGVPYVSGHEFWVLLVAQLTLVLGCLMRGL